MIPALELKFAEPIKDTDPRLLTVDVGIGRTARRSVLFRSSGPALKRTGDVLVCLGLIPAIEIGCDLLVGSPIDEGLLARCDRIQALLCQWYSGYRPIRIMAERQRTEYPPARGTGIFFSAGVDSSFSLAEERHRLSAIVTVIGADVDLRNASEATHLAATARAVGEAYGLETIVIETNLREVFDRMIGWVEYHGAALAAIRHMLADRFENQLIASSADESSWSRRWGSHPALDPLFGTEGARIEHHGLVHRLAKIERILREPPLMSHLRVCDHQYDNCGVCEDCAFMVKSLETIDAFDKAPTFPRTNYRAPRLVVTGEGSKSDLMNLRLRALAESATHPLAQEISRALAWYEARKALYTVLPLPEMKRRFKRVKRQYRYLRAARRG